jgi:hypothetical protein
MAGKAKHLSSNEIESANRAEATALLIRTGYRVYRPEADVDGEDLVVKTPSRKLIAVQLKSRLTVDLKRYGGHNRIWMLFPNKKFKQDEARIWYLVPHHELFAQIKFRHGHTKKWNNKWSSSSVSKIQQLSLARFEIRPKLHPAK